MKRTVKYSNVNYRPLRAYMLQHTATHCNTLQHTAKCCNKLQHTVTHVNILKQRPWTCSPHFNLLQHEQSAELQALDWNTHCNTLQHTATHCNTLRYTATHSNTQQHTATHGNTQQHTLTYCNTNIPWSYRPCLSQASGGRARISSILWLHPSRCVAVCCSVLQCVAVCCSVCCIWWPCAYLLDIVAASEQVCCSVLQCVAVCCSVLQCRMSAVSK